MQNQKIQLLIVQLILFLIPVLITTSLFFLKIKLKLTNIGQFFDYDYHDNHNDDDISLPE